MSPLIYPVTIVADHQLHLDLLLPSEMPIGEAELVIMVVPKGSASPFAALKKSVGVLADSSLAMRDSVELQREWRSEW